MLDEKFGCHVISINSVKGGAGKTAISLATALNIAIKDIVHEIQEDKRNRICYIDMDVLGTAVESILFTEEEMKKHINKQHKKYLNDIVDDIDLSGDIAQYIFELKVKYEEKGGRTHGGKDVELKVDCILSSLDAKTKRKHMNHISINDKKVEISVYYEYFKLFLKSLVKYKKYNYIIIDNSAGFDSISRDILEYITGREFRKTEVYEKISTSAVFITTPDKSHVNATLSMLIEYLFNERKKICDQVKLIINDSAEVLGSLKDISREEFNQSEKVINFKQKIYDAMYKQVEIIGKNKKDSSKYSFTINDIHCNPTDNIIHKNSEFMNSVTLNGSGINYYENEGLINFIEGVK